MIKQANRKEATQKRHRRIRAKLSGTAESPRLAVYRSTKHIYAQIIDDVKGVTLASASSIDKDMRKDLAHGGNIESAKADLLEKIIPELTKAAMDNLHLD